MSRSVCDEHSKHKAGCEDCCSRRRAYDRKMKLYKKHWKQRRYDQRNRLINSIKVAIGCSDCGVRSDEAVIYDFDHVRGERISPIAGPNFRVGAIDKLLTEIEKCEVVCSNCHRIRTKERASVN